MSLQYPIYTFVCSYRAVFVIIAFHSCYYYCCVSLMTILTVLQFQFNSKHKQTINDFSCISVVFYLLLMISCRRSMLFTFSSTFTSKSFVYYVCHSYRDKELILLACSINHLIIERRRKLFTVVKLLSISEHLQP